MLQQLVLLVPSVNHTTRSCNSLPESYPSAYYWVKNSTGDLHYVYCDNSDSQRCCASNGTRGWMRVAHLNMTNSDHTCPSGLVEVTSANRTCTASTTTSGCATVVFPMYGQEYRRVCGKIKAYQFSHPSAFRPYIQRNIITLNNSYVDGISLTCGRPIRQHIWTFAAAFSEGDINSQCSCTTQPDTDVVPDFVGRDFFCDTASKTGYKDDTFTANPLWDGEGCETQSKCCGFNNPPWFCKQLPAATTDDIEMRLCLNEHPDTGNILIKNIEIFVQ